MVTAAVCVVLMWTLRVLRERELFGPTRLPVWFEQVPSGQVSLVPGSAQKRSLF